MQSGRTAAWHLACTMGSGKHSPAGTLSARPQALTLLPGSVVPLQTGSRMQHLFGQLICCVPASVTSAGFNGVNQLLLPLT